MFSDESVCSSICCVKGDLAKKTVLCSVAGWPSLPLECQEARLGRDNFAVRRTFLEIYFVCVMHKYATSLLELKQKH